VFPHTHVRCDALCGFQLNHVPLSIAKRHGVRLEPFRLRYGQYRGRIETAAQQNDGFALRGGSRGCAIGVRHSPGLY
jgi:hypothetical protein